MEAEYQKKLLFHFGKAIWNSVPVVGPFVSEMVYEAHKDDFLESMERATANLSAEEIERLESYLERMERSAVDAISNAKVEIGSNLDEIQAKVDRNEQLMSEGFETVVDTIRNLQDSIDAANLDNRQRAVLEKSLAQLKERRSQWVARISATQRNILANIPDQEENGLAFSALESQLRKEMPELWGARTKEIHFRLHELRWLGLIDRTLVPEGDEGQRAWRYWRTEDGHELITGSRQ